MGKNKIALLLIIAFSLSCAGGTEKNPAAEQGELVKNERLSEKSDSLFLHCELYCRGEMKSN